MEAPAAPVRCVVRFGVFELDVRSGELRRSGVLLNLQDQPLKVLECLLERPGELVSREALRQRLWPGDTFVDFEQGVNAAVKRLRETLADSAESPRFVETLPRRGYRFIAPVDRDNRDQLGLAASAPNQCPGVDASPAIVEMLPGGARQWRYGLFAAGAIALVLMTIAAWLRRASPEAPPARLRVLSLTTLTGSEFGATFSPDGSQVAFAWDGEQQDNFDIYVKLVGSSDVRRLTTHAAFDFAPQWSPDGKRIAYVQSESPTSSQIRLMSSLGGSERALSHFPVRPPATWSPDGRYVVAGRAPEAGAADQSNGIYLFPVEIGEPRPITRVMAPANDGWPAFSPDGRHLAYASCQDLANRSNNCHVHVLDLDSTFAPLGSPRRFTPTPFWTIQGLAWTRDGTFIVFAARQGPSVNLWRVAADGTHEPVRIEVAGMDAAFPATTASADRLAFSKSIEDEDLFRFDVGGIARPVARSSVLDTNAQFSPDGRRMAFCSARSGDEVEVWVAEIDGSKPERLTRGPGRWQCSPAWSPDGKRIAFDSQAEDGFWHIWTMEVEGGTPQPVTKESGDQVRPTWSRDGQWIYFNWRRGNDVDVWRTRGPDRPHERVTHSGTETRAWESADGTGVFYKRRLSDSPLYFQPLSGGASRPIIACVTASRFSIVPHGIYYVPCQAHGSVNRDMPLRVLNPVTGEDRQFATLEIPFPASSFRVGYLAVSPDGQTVLYSRLVSHGADLMLIENFR